MTPLCRSTTWGQDGLAGHENGGQVGVDRVGSAARSAKFRPKGVQLRRSAGYNGGVLSLVGVDQDHGASQSAGPTRFQGYFTFHLHPYVPYCVGVGQSVVA